MTVLNNPNRAAFLAAEQSDPTATADVLLRHTGFARCQNCGHVVRTQTLAALPEHRCTQRQALRRTNPEETLMSDDEPMPCGESGCLCYGVGEEHADCACGCDCPRCLKCGQLHENCDCED